MAIQSISQSHLAHQTDPILPILGPIHSDRIILHTFEIGFFPNLKKKKTNEKCLKTLSFNDKDKIKGKVNSTMFDFLV